MKIYIISDTHFNHEKIIEYCNRPQNHEELMIKALRSLTPEDCLVHLGDVCMGNDEVIHQLIRMNATCRKILVLGNHDSKTWSWYMERGWDFVCDAFQLQYAGKVLHFSHKPEAWDGVWDINVHGHLHNLGHRSNEYKELKKWHRLYSPELMNYEPIELAQFIQKAYL